MSFNTTLLRERTGKSTGMGLAWWSTGVYTVGIFSWRKQHQHISQGGLGGDSRCPEDMVVDEHRDQIPTAVRAAKATRSLSRMSQGCNDLCLSPSAHQVLARKWKEVYLSRRESKGSLVSQRRFYSNQQRPAQQRSLVWQWDDTRCMRPSFSCASIKSAMGLRILSHQKALLGIKVQMKAVFLKHLCNKLKR